MLRHIFLVGPASVGKTTVGELLARKLGHPFVDVDQEFCHRIGLIPHYIGSKSYAEYAEANSSLVKGLIKEASVSTVFATPSGFLAHEGCPEIVSENVRVIREYTSILLLPGLNPLEFTTIIATRQVGRWPKTNFEKQKEKFIERFEKYKLYGDIKIFSNESPGDIVECICAEIEKTKTPLS